MKGVHAYWQRTSVHIVSRSATSASKSLGVDPSSNSCNCSNCFEILGRASGGVWHEQNQKHIEFISKAHQNHIKSTSKSFKKHIKKTSKATYQANANAIKSKRNQVLWNIGCIGGKGLLIQHLALQLHTISKYDKRARWLQEKVKCFSHWALIQGSRGLFLKEPNEDSNSESSSLNSQIMRADSNNPNETSRLPYAKCRLIAANCRTRIAIRDLPPIYPFGAWSGGAYSLEEESSLAFKLRTTPGTKIRGSVNFREHS
jgi:hypothetical protein